MIDLVKSRLASFRPATNPMDKGICASVLIPLFENGAGTHVLLTKRTETVKHHKSEISFPGGMCEDDDEDTLATAMRESYEEVGVRPEDVTILGRLDDMNTFTGFVITPYVGLIPYPYEFTLNPSEVTYLINLPLSYLFNYDHQMESADYKGDTVEAPAIYYQGERIWGATCRMLLQLRRIVQNGQH